MTFVCSIDDAVRRLAPDFRALSLVFEHDAPKLLDADFASAKLSSAVAGVGHGPDWAEAHLAAWANVFRKFGAKPQRTPCSAQSLRDRALRSGTLGSINPVVDLYNAISLKYAVPVGGENVAAYVGAARLVVADGSETFDTMNNGLPHSEHPEPGEVVWRDDVGVTCRRWNWRQGVRTRLDATSTHMWFVLESLPEMPLEALHNAGQELSEGLQTLFGNMPLTITLLGKD